MRKVFSWIHKHERHLSAAAMVAGFVFDNFFFTRIDLAITHQIFIAYLALAAVSIAWLHYLEEYTPEGAKPPRWRAILPILTQFALGGLWSGFLIFFSRSATVATSWPFLLVLGAIFLGNEVFRKYHNKLVFNAVLYFFALYSYVIFTIPLLTHDIGTGTFILSGVVAVGTFAVFLYILRRLGKFRFSGSIWPIRFWAGILFIVVNIFYLTNILPPLPLALSAGGVYHSLERSQGGYVAQAEEAPWYTSFGINPTIHVAPGERLYAYSAIFAPISLSTKVLHVWEWYNPGTKRWQEESRISFSISGGREGGYRGYTFKDKLEKGSWRVKIETVDGRLIGQIGFYVELVDTPAITYPKTLD